MKCSACGGTGKITNPDWERAFNQLDVNYPDYDRARKQASRWCDEYIACKKCNGTGKVLD